MDQFIHSHTGFDILTELRRLENIEILSVTSCLERRRCRCGFGEQIDPVSQISVNAINLLRQGATPQCLHQMLRFFGPLKVKNEAKSSFIKIHDRCSHLFPV